MISRKPLLLTLIEWEKEALRWKKAQKQLKRAAKKIHKKVERRVDRLESRGPKPDESHEQFANRLLDKEERLRNKLFAKKAKKLQRLKDREERRYAAYTSAEARPKRPRKMFSLARTRLSTG